MDSLIGSDLDMEMTDNGPDGEEKPVLMQASATPPPVPMSASSLTTTANAPPQPTGNVIDPEFLEVYGKVRKAYGNLEGDESAINNMALEMASLLHNEIKNVKAEVRKTDERVEMNTDEGRAIASIMAELPAVNKEGARQIYHKINKMQLEHAAKGPTEGGNNYRLSAHDRKVISTLGITDKMYLDTATQLEKGSTVDAHGRLQFQNGLGVNSRGEVVFEKF